jgi:S1-C subfamily serine protease
MSEPAVENTPLPPAPMTTPTLRREALLPRERRGGLGAVALLCSLAGVASGFALATTILATQLAQSEARVGRRIMVDPGPHAFLGVTYDPMCARNAVVTGVKANTPAAEIGLAVGDRIVRVDGELMDQRGELAKRIMALPIGHEATLEVRRGDTTMLLHPTLIRRP